jgi:hypothetical protein
MSELAAKSFREPTGTAFVAANSEILVRERQI